MLHFPLPCLITKGYPINNPARKFGRGIGHMGEVAAGGMASLEFEPTCIKAAKNRARNGTRQPECAMKCMKNE